MARHGTNALVITLALGVAVCFAACRDTGSPAAPASEKTLVLLGESNLTSDCYDWPPPPLQLPGYVDYALPVSAGGPAIDFTLEDTDGNEHSLSGLLASKPVLIVFGAYT